MQLSTGPFTYNRFSVLDEKAKPDYLDFDKDGDKKEPMKKALKEKGKKPMNEGKGELPDFIKKKMDEKKGKKGDDCKCDKKEMKEWALELVDEGHDLSMFSFSDLMEMMESYGNKKKAKKPMKEANCGSSAKKKAKKLSEEEAVSFLMGEGYANNEVSAAIIWTHAADAWKEAVTEAYEG